MAADLNTKIIFPRWLLTVIVISTISLIYTIYVLAEKSNLAHITIYVVIVLLAVFLFSAYRWIVVQRKQFQSNYDAEVDKFALIQHFEYIIRYANDIILFLDDQNRVIEANDRALEVYGYSREDMLLLPGEKLFVAQPDFSIQNWFAKLHEEGTFMGEAIHVTEGGVLFPVEISARTIILEEREFSQAIIRDISERKNAEKILKERESLLAKQNEELLKLERAVEQSPVSIVITDTDGNIEYVNPKFTELTGYSFQEAYGNNPRILKSGETDPQEYTELWNAISAKNEWKGVFHNKKKNGELFWEIASISPVLDTNKKITHYIAVKEDITKQRQAERELEQNQLKIQEQYEEYQQLYLELQKSYTRIQEINMELMTAKDKAVESDKLKSAFLANLSHEIRTPMNGIIGFSEMLAMDNIPSDKRKHYTEVIINSTNQLLSIVNDILDLSKIETGQISLAREQVKINKLLIELLSFYKPKSDAKGIQLVVDKSLSDEESILISDKLRLYQILSNLLGNAIKFTKEGSVSFGYNLKNKELEFFITDSGIGIPVEYQHRLFGRFQQANSEISRNYGGTGLGLAISKSLVELLGGKIWFTSTYGKGTSFYFTIPYVTIGAPSNVIAEKIAVNKIETPLNILVAEDEEINFIFIREVLIDQPVKLIHAENGVEAIEFCKLHPEIDLILMDIKMPLMDGIDATMQIKQFRQDIPVIALTAYAMKEDKIRAINAGCNDYLSKPVRSAELLACIKKNTQQLKHSSINVV